MSIGVCTIQGGAEGACTVAPMRLADAGMEGHVGLLCVRDPRGHNVERFVWVGSLSRLVGSQLSGHGAGRVYLRSVGAFREYGVSEVQCSDGDCSVCGCLHCFGSGEGLESRAVDCQQLSDCAVILPSEDDG